MTEEQQGWARALAAHGVRAECPCCGRAQWGTPIEVNAKDQYFHPVIIRICVGCGFEAQHSSEVLGVMEDYRAEQRARWEAREKRQPWWRGGGTKRGETDGKGDGRK